MENLSRKFAILSFFYRKKQKVGNFFIFYLQKKKITENMFAKITKCFTDGKFSSLHFSIVKEFRSISDRS